MLVTLQIIILHKTHIISNLRYNPNSKIVRTLCKIQIKTDLGISDFSIFIDIFWLFHLIAWSFLRSLSSITLCSTRQYCDSLAHGFPWLHIFIHLSFIFLPVACPPTHFSRPALLSLTSHTHTLWALPLLFLCQLSYLCHQTHLHPPVAH